MDRYGGHLGRVQGVGFALELLARLTQTPLPDCALANINTTLCAERATFPLDRTFYADFSHDNVMVAIFSALGLFAQDGELDAARMDVRRTWRVGRMVPFAGRMVVEKLACARAGAGAGAGTDPGSSAAEMGEYVRILVNDAVQPLELCVGVDADGLCALDAFVASLGYVRDGWQEQWEECLE